jgi:transcriptional regulator with XRE-family HTH domain
MNNIGILLGQEIRKIRQNRQMSQEELAFKAGLSAAHLGQIERAAKNPTIETVYAIASALDVSLSELFSFASDFSASPAESITINKITAYLSKMTPDEQKDFLKIIKILKKSNK